MGADFFHTFPWYDAVYTYRYMGVLEGHPVLESFLIVGLSPYFWYYNGIGNRIYTLNLPPAPFVLADLPFPKYSFTQLPQLA